MARLSSRIEPDGSLTILVAGEVILSRMPPNTEMALSHELARHAGSDCPCHRVPEQRFFDRENQWRIVE